MEGGELFARIQERAHNAFTERGKMGFLTAYILRIELRHVIFAEVELSLQEGMSGMVHGCWRNRC